MYVNVKDEYGIPLEGIGIKANSLEKEVFTDEKGEALLTDLQAYEKIQLKLDEETFPDVSLQTLEPTKKIILRPGTIRPLNIELKHFGAVEGKLENINNRLLFGYMIVGKDKDDNEVSSTFADTEGYFVLDGLPFNTYKIEIIKDGTLINSIDNIEINDVITYIEQEITLFEKLLPQIEKEDETKENDN